MPIDNLTCKTCIHRTKSDDIVRCQKGDIEIQNERNIYVPCKDWKTKERLCKNQIVGSMLHQFEGE